MSECEKYPDAPAASLPNGGCVVGGTTIEPETTATESAEGAAPGSVVEVVVAKVKVDVKSPLVPGADEVAPVPAREPEPLRPLEVPLVAEKPPAPPEPHVLMPAKVQA